MPSPVAVLAVVDDAVAAELDLLVGGVLPRVPDTRVGGVTSGVARCELAIIVGVGAAGGDGEDESECRGEREEAVVSERHAHRGSRS